MTAETPPTVVPATGCPHYITTRRADRLRAVAPGHPTRCVPCTHDPVVPAGRNPRMVGTHGPQPRT